MPLYELEEGTSRKFYRVELDGTRVELTWGRIGAVGKRKVIDCKNTMEATRVFEAQCFQRRERGYSQVHDESRPRDPTAAREQENEAKLSAGAPLGKQPRFRFVHAKVKRFVWLEVRGSALVRAEGRLGDESKASPVSRVLESDAEAKKARDRETADLLASGYRLDAFGQVKA